MQGVTGIPIKTKKATVEERLQRLEHEVFEPCIWRGNPICIRLLELNTQMNKLVKHLGLYWHTENRPTPEPELRKIRKPWFE